MGLGEGSSDFWVVCVAVCVLVEGVVFGWLFRPRSHQAAKPAMATRTAASATIRTVLPLFGGIP